MRMCMWVLGVRQTYSFWFFLMLWYFVRSCPQSLYSGNWSLMAVVPVSFFCLFVCFLSLRSPQPGVTGAQKLLCLLCKTISKVGYLIIILWISLQYFDFFRSLGCLIYSIHHYQTSRSSLSFQFADLLYLFIFFVFNNFQLCFKTLNNS